jgi:hypothetical protein
MSTRTNKALCERVREARAAGHLIVEVLPDERDAWASLVDWLDPEGQWHHAPLWVAKDGSGKAILLLEEIDR